MPSAKSASQSLINQLVCRRIRLLSFMKELVPKALVGKELKLTNHQNHDYKSVLWESFMLFTDSYLEEGKTKNMVYSPRECRKKPKEHLSNSWTKKMRIKIRKKSSTE